MKFLKKWYILHRYKLNILRICPTWAALASLFRSSFMTECWSISFHRDCWTQSPYLLLELKCVPEELPVSPVGTRYSSQLEHVSLVIFISLSHLTAPFGSCTREPQRVHICKYWVHFMTKWRIVVLSCVPNNVEHLFIYIYICMYVIKYRKSNQKLKFLGLIYSVL